MTTEKQNERPFFRVVVMAKADAPKDGEEHDGKTGVVVRLAKAYRNRANAREAAAAWGQKHEVAGTLVVLEAKSENARKWTVAETRSPGFEYGAASDAHREEARQREEARSGS